MGKMSLQGNINDLLRIAGDQGFRWSPNRDNSTATVYAKDGKGMVQLRRCGDPHAYRNAVSNLKKIGVSFDPEVKPKNRLKEALEQLDAESDGDDSGQSEYPFTIVEEETVKSVVTTVEDIKPMSPIQMARAKVQEALDCLAELDTALSKIELDNKKIEALRAALAGFNS